MAKFGRFEMGVILSINVYAKQKTVLRCGGMCIYFINYEADRMTYELKKRKSQFKRINSNRLINKALQ